jgi:hypothetical protein
LNSTRCGIRGSANWKITFGGAEAQVTPPNEIVGVAGVAFPSICVEAVECEREAVCIQATGGANQIGDFVLPNVL